MQGAEGKTTFRISVKLVVSAEIEAVVVVVVVMIVVWVVVVLVVEPAFFFK